PVFEHLLLAIQVGEEVIESREALTDPALDLVPLVRIDEPRNDVEGEDTFALFVLAISEREGDALLKQRLFGRCLPAQDRIAAERLEPLKERLEPGPWLPGRFEDFVEELAFLRIVAG